MMTMVSALQGPGLPLFEADGAVDLDDRQHLLGFYSGIAFVAGIIGIVDPENVFTDDRFPAVFTDGREADVFTDDRFPAVYSTA